MKKRTIIIAFVFGVFAIACETSTYSDIEQVASTNNNVVDDDDDCCCCCWRNDEGCRCCR